MNKKYIVQIIIFFLLISIFTLNISSAMSVESLTGDFSGTKELETVGNKAITIISIVGSVLSVIVLIVIGIKYMIGSVEEKAEYKRTLMPYFIGALFIFSASTIAGIIYTLATKF